MELVMGSDQRNLTEEEALRLYYGGEPPESGDTKEEPTAGRRPPLEKLLKSEPLTEREILNRGYSREEFERVRTDRAADKWIFLEPEPLYYYLEGEEGSPAEWKIFDRLQLNLHRRQPEEIIVEAIRTAPPGATFETIVEFVNASNPLSWYGMMHRLLEEERIPITAEEKRAIMEAKAAPLSRFDVSRLGAEGLLKKRILVEVNGEFVYGYCAGIFDFFKEEDVVDIIFDANLENPKYTIALPRRVGKVLEEWHLFRNDDSEARRRMIRYKITPLGRDLIKSMQQCKFVAVEAGKRREAYLGRYEELMKMRYDSRKEELLGMLNAEELSRKLEKLGARLDIGEVRRRIVGCIRAGEKLTPMQTKHIFSASVNFTSDLIRELYETGERNRAFYLCGTAGDSECFAEFPRAPHLTGYIIEGDLDSAYLSERLVRQRFSSWVRGKDPLMRLQPPRRKNESDESYGKRRATPRNVPQRTIQKLVGKYLQLGLPQNGFEGQYKEAVDRLTKKYG